MAGIAWDTFLASTGDKLCYASITTTGNVFIKLFSSKRISEKVSLFGSSGSSSFHIGSSIFSQIHQP